MGPFTIKNPVPVTVRDKEDLKNFFQELEIVPYYGTVEASSQSVLMLINDLCELSPTFQAYRRDINAYVFGLKIDFIGDTLPGISVDNTELSQQEIINYASYLGGLGLPAPKLIKLSRRIDQFLDICGNAFLWVKRSRLNGRASYWFSVPHFLHVGYSRQAEGLFGENKVALISPYIGDKQKILEHGYDLVRVTREGEELKWGMNEDGIEETLIHITREENNSRSVYYERSPLISLLPWLYVDYEIGVLTSKIAATDIITKKILAFEGQDPNTIPMTSGEVKDINNVGQIGRKDVDYFTRNMMILRELTTNLGNHANAPGQMNGEQMKKAANVLAGVEYPYGSKAPEQIDLEVNRDVKYQDWQVNQASAVICGRLGWNNTLLGFREAKANIGGNVLKDLFVLANIRTVRPKQNEIATIWDNLLLQLKENEQFAGYGVRFGDVIGEILEQLGQSTAPATEPQEASEVNETEEENQIEENEQ
jgi:hypothetical protein